MADKVVKIENKAAQAEENDFVIKLTKTYQFEEKTVSEIDMSGLDTLTANDMLKANKVLSSNGAVSVIPEMTLDYALVIAAQCTDLPIEFYKALKPRDAIKVKNKVTAFFFGEE